MKSSVRIQLMLMMFLQFFTWGSWYGQMSVYLGKQLNATGDQIGNAYTAFSIAMIISPFIGAVADRYFSAQKVLGVLNLIGTALLFVLSQINDASNFFWFILAYCLCFAPCIALTTSISMRHIASPEKDFPTIRVMGTIAWIAVTNLIGLLDLGDKVAIFQIAMFTSAAMGLLAFTLPSTPPRATGPVNIGQIIGADAFTLFKDRSFVIFFIASVAICIPLSFYYAFANPSLRASGMEFVENKMSLGQVSEVGFMLLIPLAFSRLGVKWMLAVGLISWIVRFLCFGYGDAATSEWMLYAAILLHGVCFDFFFVTGQIYTDTKAGERIKSQAQGLITLATYGLGMGIGSWLGGKVVAANTNADKITDWLSVWMVPAGIAAGVLVLFLLFFSEKSANKAAVA
ncbi:MFS transporter [Runella sp.]|jgi:nucleoside transporter|uniref:MFS transporter n=1 Tax=Runella sp. TaxID=1960881 RepID=UPI0026257DEA|nr:MFS transporter [Runella sp.]